VHRGPLGAPRELSKDPRSTAHGKEFFSQKFVINKYFFVLYFMVFTAETVDIFGPKKGTAEKKSLGTAGLPI